jgi:glycosyltransferase involved in cell wall biosynthesis
MAAAIPQVSVILPVRNRAGLIEAAARHALGQTWRDLELIIVDGGSTDGTVDVLRRVAASDPRVRLILNPAAEGVSAARNQGARQAQGRYLAFLDSDDAWLPDKLERQLEAIGRMPGARIAYTGCRRLLPDGERLRPPTWDEPYEGDLHRQILRHGAINSSTLMVERAFFLEEGGFDESLRFYEDWDLVVRCTARSPLACARGWLVESPVLPDSLSRDRDSYYAALQYLAVKHKPYLDREPKVAEERLAEVGWRMLVDRRPGGGRWLRRALATRPLSLHAPFFRKAWTVLRYQKRPSRAPRGKRS